MSFARTEFLLFLAAVVVVIQFVPARGRGLTMLAGSALFYAYAAPLHLVLLFVSIMLDYGVGLALGRTEASGARRVWVWTSVIGNLALLVGFKYVGVLAPEVAGVQGYLGQPMHVGLELIVPLGISFYTFQSMGYSIDVYRRRVEPCRSLPRFALFVAFFPQLVAGPIEKAEHLLPQLDRLQPLTGPNLVAGIDRILIGLIKKLVFADRFRWPLLAVLDQPAGHDSLTLIASAFGLFAILYLDFSAYTDMAIGSARLFGVKLVENFDKPHLTHTVADFTRRWHMSLVNWIGEYIHAPLMGNKLSYLRLWSVNLLVMCLFGLWHGPRWNYVFCGALLGVVVSCEQSLRLSRMRRGIRRPAHRARWRILLAWAWTMCVWAFFAVGLFSPNWNSMQAFVVETCTWRTPNIEGLRFAAIVFGLMLLGLGLQARSDRWKPLLESGTTLVPRYVLAILLLTYGSVPDPTDFVYFQF
jgi:alginate O-acetyltransferase complex protein AlgI